jgi:hypothetical protein
LWSYGILEFLTAGILQFFLAFNILKIYEVFGSFKLQGNDSLEFLIFYNHMMFVFKLAKKP